MTRALIVWTFCVLLALLGVSGAHRHVSHENSGVEQHHGASAHQPHSMPGPALFAVDFAAHEYEHQVHGDVDVDLSAKVFGKIPLSKVDLSLWAWVIAFILVVQFVWIRGRFTPPNRPPRCRWHPFSLPPAHAPPHTA